MTRYPIILCGDHAEFEAGWAKSGKPDRERPDWPLSSFDAKDWAETFCKIANEQGIKDAEGKPLDESWMFSWFANALMRGHDEYASKTAGPMRYNIASDELVLVTQEWVDSVQVFANKFGLLREQARNTQKAAQEFLAAWKPEFEQKK